MPSPHRLSGWTAILLTAGCAVAKQPAPAAESAAPEAVSRGDAAAIIADLRWIDTTEGIAELRPIEVGGITQWISIRGKHRDNPILLFVHGGPGSPMMPASWVFQTPWEEYFTVVQWDQRGAGKTAAANDPAVVTPTIDLERMVADGEEIVAYLRDGFGKRKIFLLGHSWGTFIGVEIARRRPEWLHAYIGMGQAVNAPANERAGYEFALGEARRRDDRAALAELEGIAPYPAPDGSVTVEQILTQRKWVIAYGGLTWGRSDYGYEQGAVRLSPDYDARDLAALRRAGLGSLTQLIGAMNAVRYDETALDFRCPIVIFAGRYDYETVSDVARAWFDKIAAPSKRFVWFEHSAHMIPFEEPGKLLLHLVQDVRPLAASGE
ncbi:MAG: alpha/beta fold hydrolase [Gemmatimonadales bacterium]